MTYLRSGILVAGLLLVAAPSARAVTISREGSAIVVRPDAGEPLTDFDVIANADRDSFAVHKRAVSGDEIPSQSGPGCDGGASSCDIGNATALRVELGAGNQELLVSGSPIPVIVDGGAGDDRLTVRGGPSITVNGGDGNDTLTLQAWAPAGGTQEGTSDEAVLNPPTKAAAADGGAGNDKLSSTVSGAKLTGGDGNDTLDAVSEVQTTEQQTARHPSRQVLDCGAGADTAMVDHLDTLGAGCGPSISALKGDDKLQNTLGRFDTKGILNVPSFLRTTRAVTARLTLTGPRLAGRRRYASATKHVNGAVRATLRPAAPVRAKLAHTTGSVSSSVLSVALKSGRDTTLVTLFGSLKPKG